jgi:hypothetical protein
MKITTQRTGGIWHGYLEGHPEVDERGLTEEVARRKVERIVEKIAEDSPRQGQTVFSRNSDRRLKSRR